MATRASGQVLERPWVSRRSAARRHRQAAIDDTRPHPGVETTTRELTIVVPFYNPGEDAVFDTVRSTRDVLTDLGLDFEITAVSDGSTDGSHVGLDPLLSENVACRVLDHNSGKGYAVRTGLACATGHYVGFIDGDGDIPPDVLGEFVAIARSAEPAMIVGSKYHAASSYTHSLSRRAYSWGYRRLVRVLFGLSVRDTQVGVKLIRQDVARAVLPLMSEDRYAFDLELLALASCLGFDDIVEAPVRINPRRSSTISLRSVVTMFGDTLAIFWRIRMRRSYRQVGQRTPQAPRTEPAPLGADHS